MQMTSLFREISQNIIELRITQTYLGVSQDLFSKRWKNSKIVCYEIYSSIRSEGFVSEVST